MPKGYPGTGTPRSVSHHKAEAARCADSWWTRALTWKEFSQMASQRLPAMLAHGVSHLVLPYVEMPPKR